MALGSQIQEESIFHHHRHQVLGMRQGHQINRAQMKLSLKAGCFLR